MGWVFNFQTHYCDLVSAHRAFFATVVYIFSSIYVHEKNAYRLGVLHVLPLKSLNIGTDKLNIIDYYTIVTMKKVVKNISHLSTKSTATACLLNCNEDQRKK